MLSTFKYYKPQTLQEANQFLTQNDAAYVLAGGTDLMILLRRNFIDAKHIVDIKAIPEMDQLSYSDEDGAEIGARVVVNRLIGTDWVKEKYPALHQACETLASHQLRNRATLVGNICNASPGADLPPSLLVYDATVKIAGVDGEGDVKLSEFFTGVKKTVLKKGDLVVSVHLPPPGSNDKSVYLKQSRLKGHDLATVGVACRKNGEGRVSAAICAVAVTPLRLTELEKGLNEGELDEEKILWAAEEIQKHIKPISDVRSSAEYRKHIAGVLLKRGLRLVNTKEG